MFKHKLSDHPLALRKQSCLGEIRVVIHSSVPKILTVMKMYLIDDISLASRNWGLMVTNHWKIMELRNGPTNNSAIQTHGRISASSPPFPRYLGVTACY